MGPDRAFFFAKFTYLSSQMNLKQSAHLATLKSIPLRVHVLLAINDLFEVLTNHTPLLCVYVVCVLVVFVRITSLYVRTCTVHILVLNEKLIHLSLTGRYVPLNTEPPAFVTTDDWSVLLYPATSPQPLPSPQVPLHQPTLLPLPKPDGNNQHSANYDEGSERDFEKEFNEKWNVDEAPEEQTDAPPVPTKSMPGTMVLVIGIIVGAFMAMVLIVIIVLKMRTRVDGTIKCDDTAPRYQFAAPNDYGEIGGAAGGHASGPGPGLGAGAGPGGVVEEHGARSTATTSLMEGARRPLIPTAPMGAAAAPPPSNQSHNNGFFGSSFANALNGDRSRLFRKSNGSKPIREWYV